MLLIFGHFGISFLELLDPFRAMGWSPGCTVKRLLGLMLRAGRPILLPSVPVSEGIEIRHGCQFIK